MPRISALIPIFNQVRFCRQAIESLLRQTFSDFEIIVVDDGSTDDTGAIIDEMAKDDSRIKVFHRSHEGIVGALNFGLQVASCELVARSDGDTLSRPERFARQLAFLTDNPAVTVLGSDVVFMTEDGRSTHRSKLPAGHADIYSALIEFNCIAHPSIMMRGPDILRLGGYRPQFEYAEDYDLWLRVSESGQIVNLPLPIVYHRIHKGAISSTRRLRQELHARIARYAAQARRSGLPDPMAQVRIIDRAAIEALCLPGETLGELLSLLDAADAADSALSRSNDAALRQ